MDFASVVEVRDNDWEITEVAELLSSLNSTVTNVELLRAVKKDSLTADLRSFQDSNDTVARFVLIHSFGTLKKKAEGVLEVRRKLRGDSINTFDLSIKPADLDQMAFLRERLQKNEANLKWAKESTRREIKAAYDNR